MPAVGTDGDRPAPAAVGVDRTFYRGGFGIHGPDVNFAGVMGAEPLAADARQAADPTAMTDEPRLALVGEFEALDLIVLRGGEHEAARRIKAAADERAVVPQLERQAGAGGIDRHKCSAIGSSPINDE